MDWDMLRAKWKIILNSLLYTFSYNATCQIYLQTGYFFYKSCTFEVKYSEGQNTTKFIS